MEWLLFPNQLFSLEILREHGIRSVVVMEEGLYYRRPGIRFNQLRILFMHVMVRAYVDYLKKGGVECRLVPYGKTPAVYKGYRLFDPCDLLLRKKLKDCVLEDSPSFLLTAADIEKLPKPKSRMQQTVVYKYVKEKLGVLVDTPSQDMLNRKPFSKNIPLPPTAYRHRFSEEKVWLEGVAWLQRSAFKKNPTGYKGWEERIREYLVYLPLTPDQVDVWLGDFFKERFKLYGPYQDVVLVDTPLLYHSGLSIYLNNGMITPEKVIRAAMKVRGVPLNSLEGFVRQIAGWREYARYYYLITPVRVYGKNVFGNGLDVDAALYKGETPFPVVNHTIQYAMNYGYINHIQRLMIMSNYMTLFGYSPDALFKWMFEFSLDSYEWVMVFNCYSMGSWGDGGWAMRKPYVSSAAYITKMSGREALGNATEQWNQAFDAFQTKHQPILEHTPFFYGRRMGRRNRPDR